MADKNKKSDKGNSTDGDGKKPSKKDVLQQMSSVHNKLQQMLENDEPLPPLLDRPDLKPRAVASMIDFFAGVIVVFVFTTVGMFMSYVMLNIFMMAGAVLAGGFMLAKDGIYKSSSPGKIAVGLRVVDEEGHFIGIGTSAARNVMPALPFFAIVAYCVLNIIVPSLSQILSALVGLAAAGALGYETYTLLLDRTESRRWGDLRAGTKVIELDD